MITKSQVRALIPGNYQQHVLIKCRLTAVPAVMEWGWNEFLQGEIEWAEPLQFVHFCQNPTQLFRGLGPSH